MWNLGLLFIKLSVWIDCKQKAHKKHCLIWKKPGLVYFVYSGWFKMNWFTFQSTWSFYWLWANSLNFETLYSAISVRASQMFIYCLYEILIWIPICITYHEHRPPNQFTENLSLSFHMPISFLILFVPPSLSVYLRIYYKYSIYNIIRRCKLQIDHKRAHTSRNI